MGFLQAAGFAPVNEEPKAKPAWDDSDEAFEERKAARRAAQDARIAAELARRSEMPYQIISANELDELQDQVCEYISRGFVPTGGIHLSDKEGMFSQAVMRIPAR